MEFVKMHGIGNDYIYVNCLSDRLKNPEKLAVKLSDRHYGIGSDGLIMICSSDIADFKMEMFNADGSQAEMCGNGIRCVGKFVYDKGLTDKTNITVETSAGIKNLALKVKDHKCFSVIVDMGQPELIPSKIPVIFDGDVMVNQDIEVAGVHYKITCVATGNPHAVVFVEEVDALDLESIGPLFENHTIFPNRVNTEFIEVIDSHHLKMRVWERGSGETLACGTGACASLVAAVLNGYCGDNARISLKGGDLGIRWDREHNRVYMEGGAVEVFTGFVNLDEFI